MENKKPVIVKNDIISAYGLGVEICWESLINGTSAIGKNHRFNTTHMGTEYAGLVPGVKYSKEKSLLKQILEPLIRELKKYEIPSDTLLILSTINGEVDNIEKSLIDNLESQEYSNFSNILQTIKEECVLENEGMLISAACASSNIAMGYAGEMIKKGYYSSILVIGCDCVSEFLMSGFSSLQALDKKPAKPFDERRNGLTAGEGAGVALLMSKERAHKERRAFSVSINGWGSANDAHHITAPSKEANGLVSAINLAFQNSSINKGDIGFINAHGTGTIFNDAMELNAFKKIFDTKCPAFSIKGGTGHTMGAAGIIELLISSKTLKEKIVPPTVNMEYPDKEALAWFDTKAKEINSKYCISINSGFAGINSALILKSEV